MSMCPAKTHISLGIRPIWSESSLSAWRKLGSLATHWAHSEDSDQTGWIPRLIWVFAGRTATLLVLSCRGSLCFIKEKRGTSVADPESGTLGVLGIVKKKNHKLSMRSRLLVFWLALRNDQVVNSKDPFAGHERRSCRWPGDESLQHKMKTRFCSWQGSHFLSNSRFNFLKKIGIVAYVPAHTHLSSYIMNVNFHFSSVLRSPLEKKMWSSCKRLLVNQQRVGRGRGGGGGGRW